ncbi:hypothetical protein HY410_00035 [Candidatus Gottesmanbacteria bacterium]|nr:hypothetical protein [Candidatus Gottesmanbacteria bacterium]
MVLRKALVVLAFCVFSLATAPGVGAFFWDDWFLKAKEVISPLIGQEANEGLLVSIDSSVALAPGGDVNRNGQVDGGDTVTFSYTLTNTSDAEYTFLTLVTNIDRNQLHFIHNVQGTASLSDRNGTVIISNVRLGPLQELVIRFDARTNFNTTTDMIIATQPELLNEEIAVIGRSKRKEVKAKKWLGQLPSMILGR